MCVKVLLFISILYFKSTDMPLKRSVFVSIKQTENKKCIFTVQLWQGIEEFNKYLDTIFIYLAPALCTVILHHNYELGL